MTFYIGFVQTEWEIKILLIMNSVLETENKVEEMNHFEKVIWQNYVDMTGKLKSTSETVIPLLRGKQQWQKKIG